MDKNKSPNNPRPRSARYYIDFSKASKKIGNIATTSFFSVREFLNREVNLPSVSGIAEPFTSLISKAFDDMPQKSNDRTAESENNSDDDDLDTVIKNSNEILAEASTVFPFTLFPDTITVDRTKLTITRRTFFQTSKVLTIHIEDILNISADVGPFFGSLTIAIKGLTSEDHFSMNFFWRKDAIHLKHIIQGHMMAQHEGIDYRHLEHKKLVQTLIELGRDSNPEM